MKTNSGGAEFRVSRAYSYGVFALLFLLYMFDYTDRILVSSVFPYLKKDWGLSDTQCGLLMSVVYWSVLAFTLPVSIMVDRWSRKKSIAIMAILWSVATGACAFARSFTQLFTARALVGVGEAGYTGGGYAMISAYFPPEKRATMNGLFNAAIPLGAAFGITLGGIIAVQLGWRYVFGLMAIPGLIGGLLFFLVRDYKTIQLSGGGSAAPKMRMADIVRQLLATPSLLGAYFGHLGSMFVTTAYIAWLPTYYNRFHGLPMDKAGMKTSLLFLLAIVGAPLGGFLTDRLCRKNPNARLAFPAVTALIAGLAFFSAFSFAEGTPQYVLLLLGGFTAPMFVAGAAAVTQEVVHPGLRAVSFSCCSVVQNLFGASLGPIFVGWVSDHYGLMAGLKLVPIMSGFAFVTMLIASFYYKSDLEKVGKFTLLAGE